MRLTDSESEDASLEEESASESADEDEDEDYDVEAEDRPAGASGQSAEAGEENADGITGRYLFNAGDNWQDHLRLLDPQSQQALLHVDEQEASEIAAAAAPSRAPPAAPTAAAGFSDIDACLAAGYAPHGLPTDPRQMVLCQTRQQVAAEAEEAAIWQRTRARQPMLDVSLDQLSAMLSIDEEGELGVLEEDEEEQYQEFLQALQGDQVEMPEDDDLDDMDFEADLEDLLPDPLPPEELEAACPEEEGTWPEAQAQQEGNPPSRRRRREPRTRAQHAQRDRAAIRELESTARLRDKQLKPLLPSGPAAAQPGSWTPQQRGQLHKQVHEHAQMLIQGMALARLMGNANRVQMAHIPCSGDARQYTAHVRSLLMSLQGFAKDQVMRNWHLDVHLEGLPEPVPGCRRGSEDAVHSVAQVAPLYHLDGFLKDFDIMTEGDRDAASSSVMMGSVETALERFSGIFDPQMYPRLRVLGENEQWTPGEEALLAAGLLRFGMKLEAIRNYLLPAKSVHGIKRHQQLRSKASADSIVKAAAAMVTGPLTTEEFQRVERFLVLHGNNAATKWEEIATQVLPHRPANRVQKLYNAARDKKRAASDVSACTTFEDPSRQPRPVTKRRGRPSKQMLADRQRLRTQERLTSIGDPTSHLQMLAHDPSLRQYWTGQQPQQQPSAAVQCAHSADSSTGPAPATSAQGNAARPVDASAQQLQDQADTSAATEPASTVPHAPPPPVIVITARSTPQQETTIAALAVDTIDFSEKRGAEGIAGTTVWRSRLQFERMEMDEGAEDRGQQGHALLWDRADLCDDAEPSPAPAARQLPPTQLSAPAAVCSSRPPVIVSVAPTAKLPRLPPGSYPSSIVNIYRTSAGLNRHHPGALVDTMDMCDDGDESAIRGKSTDAGEAAVMADSPVPWTEEDDRPIFQVALIAAKGSPSRSDLMQLSRKLQQRLPPNLHGARSLQAVQQRIATLQERFAAFKKQQQAKQA
ncbi:hypothetical protein WJX73_000725 [Symbiochloris irregularis]|uniref:Myb-like domain-containing protein n=1 Tax=Symbiochloris irregularis TaxID=706552 RepID=A0AAW1NVW0_9CHLO